MRNGAFAGRAAGVERRVRARRVDRGPKRSDGRRTLMDAGLLHGLWTAAMIAVFAAIVAWAWSGRRKRDFEEAARLPLEEDAESEQGVTDPHPRGARHG